MSIHLTIRLYSDAALLHHYTVIDHDPSYSRFPIPVTRMNVINERLDGLLSPANRSSISLVSQVRDYAVETSEVISKCMAIAKFIDEDLDNCAEPNEIRLLFARVLGVQPRDVPMQNERIKEFVGVTRDELCSLLSKNFTPCAIDKMHWTMGLASHILISCNFHVKLIEHLLKPSPPTLCAKRTSLSISRSLKCPSQWASNKLRP